MVDPQHSAIKADKVINWICQKQHRGRAFRSLTSAGKKVRSLRRRGRGAEKFRPSLKRGTGEA
jgi:large subunit ribosomal protein L15e